MTPLPVNEFIIKIASRCNLNCDYCYEYNLGDSTWKRQPPFMSDETIGLAASRIAEHARSHRLDRVHIAFHGGEPLLAGPERIARYAQVLHSTIAPHAIPEFSIQTNGALADDDVVQVLVRHRIAVGVSIDGPKVVNDLHRLDHRARSTFEATCKGIEALRSAGVLKGLLSVIDARTDPLEVFDFIATLGVDNVDFLLPHHNWLNRPPRPGDDVHAYGKWYLAIWRAWVRGRHSWMRIRYLDQIVRSLAGGASLFEGLGIEPVQLLVIAADGSLEGVDTLKSTGDGQQILGLTLRDGPIDDVLTHAAYQARQGAAAALCDQCRACRWVRSCGGGYYTHRYIGGGSFAAPSVYCADLLHLFDAVHEDISEMASQGKRLTK